MFEPATAATAAAAAAASAIAAAVAAATAMTTADGRQHRSAPLAPRLMQRMFSVSVSGMWKETGPINYQDWTM